jgi:hypothetical protein
LGYRGIVAAATQKEERGKDEKSALKHCLGNGGIACVGPDYATAAYE